MYLATKRMLKFNEIVGIVYASVALLKTAGPLRYMKIYSTEQRNKLLFYYLFYDNSECKLVYIYLYITCNYSNMYICKQHILYIYISR